MDSSESILIVEDESIIALMEQQTLQNNGYEVYLAADRDSAIEIVCSDRKVDLILMDIDLGEGKPDGTEIAREILSLCSIPVIFLSSHSEPEIVRKTEKITSYGYIVKGCNDTILLASIKMAFKLHKSNEEKEKSNAYLRTLLEASPDGIWVSDRYGRILDVNHTYCNLSGYSKDELIGRFISEIDSESDYEEVAAQVRELKPGGTIRLSSTHRKKNGDPLYVEVSIARINLDSDPEIVTFCRDCTEERRLSESIRAVEQKFENIIGSIQDAVFTLDPDMKITGVFGPWVERHDADAKALMGIRFSDGMEKMGADFDESVFYDALHNGFSMFETELPTPDGKKHFQISLSQIKNNHGKITGVVGIGRNITELIRVREDLSEREQLYSRLLSQVPGAIYQFRYFPDGRSCFPFTSQNIELVYEVTPDEVEYDASPVFERIHPDDYNGVCESIVVSKDNLCDWVYDYRVVLPSRGVRWLRGRATPEACDDGSVLWCGFITDITDLKVIEAELSGRKELLQMTLQSIDDALITTDLNGGITDINDTAAGLTGWSTGDALGKPLSEVFNIMERIEDPSLNDSGNLTVLCARDGKKYRILESEAPIRGNNGRVEGSVVVFRDVTEKYDKRKQLEATIIKLNNTLKQLGEQSHMLQSVIDATGAGTWAWNVQTGEVTINERWAEMLGYKTEELDPVSIETWKNLAHPEDLEKSNQALAEHFTKRTGFYECEVRMRHKDGRWVRILDRGSASTWTVEGEPEWIYGTHLDISDRVMPESLLIQREQYLRALFQNSEMGFALHEVLRDENNIVFDYKFIEANENFGKLIGIDYRSLLHRRATEAIPEIKNEPEDWISKFAGVVDSGNPAQFEFFSNPLNRWYSVTVYRPKEEMFATIFFDITDNRKMLKERESALNNQKILMKELNHRVKNNLLMVKSLIHLKDLEAGDQTDLGDIESRVQAIADLHEELQETARLDRVPLHSYITRIAENVIDNNPSPVELVLDLTEQDVSTRQAVSIGLIINEAATNAIKHGFDDEPEPRLEISSQVNTTEGTVRIANNGRALPESLDINHPHSLGLKLIATLAKQMNGSVEVVRKPHPVFILHYRL